jgi:hypothetical protein
MKVKKGPDIIFKNNNNFKTTFDTKIRSYMSWGQKRQSIVGTFAC